MTRPRYFLWYFFVVVFQILVCNHLHVSQYLVLSVLPVIVLLIPLQVSTIAAMLVAFATGIAVDMLADGLIGLNALALVPVALLRKPLIARIFGTEAFASKEDISLEHYGYMKFTIAIVLVQLLFLVIYVVTDSAGVRPFLFCLIRTVVSLAAGVLVSLPLAGVLSKENRDR